MCDVAICCGEFQNNKGIQKHEQLLSQIEHLTLNFLGAMVTCLPVYLQLWSNIPKTNIVNHVSILPDFTIFVLFTTGRLFEN
jgi:hypothetical protein